MANVPGNGLADRQRCPHRHRGRRTGAVPSRSGCECRAGRLAQLQTPRSGRALTPRILSTPRRSATTAPPLPASPVPWPTMRRAGVASHPMSCYAAATFSPRSTSGRPTPRRSAAVTTRPRPGVDIVNMSFGSLGREANVLPLQRDVLTNGVKQGRDGRGIVYVKAAGNGYGSCRSMRRPVNAEIGCGAANGDSTNNTPWVIVVGGFSASGARSSYSATGSNLWVSAPSGERGRDHPAQITVDQFGPERGYGAWIRRGLALEDIDGGYISTFSGTSAAAPNASGAIALLLEAYPRTDLARREAHPGEEGPPDRRGYRARSLPGRRRRLHPATTVDNQRRRLRLPQLVWLRCHFGRRCPGLRWDDRPGWTRKPSWRPSR